jgi:TRAP-type C4-dicarboxylate transport system substrate-binding protein
MLVTFANVQVSAYAADAGLTLSVHTEDPNHLSWVSALELTQHLSNQKLSLTPSLRNNETSADFKLVPLYERATEIPAQQGLTLPFYYQVLVALHRSLDNGLLDLLKNKSRTAGWELLAVWDEGLRHFSGNRRFDRRINLTGMEFILLNPDPVAEKQYRAFDAWTRDARPSSQQELLKQCLVGSRADTLQRIWQDRLDRVHLDISLSGHRYKGWVLVSAVERWQQISIDTKQSIQNVLLKMQSWQRQEALLRETAALEYLKDRNMTVHHLTEEQRQVFRARLPEDMATLLPDALSADEKQQLLTATAAFMRSARPD